MHRKYPGLTPYGYCGNNPVMYTDPTGMWGRDIHYGSDNQGTLAWMQEGGRFTKTEAKFIATANNTVDNVAKGKSYLPVLGDQAYHFNTNGKDKIDSRQEKADFHLEKAIGLKNKAKSLREKGGLFNCIAYFKEKAALEHLGQGLHALQDIDAHTDDYVEDNWNGINGIKSHPTKAVEEKNGRIHADDADGRPEQVEKTKMRSLEYVDKYLDATK